MSDELQSELKPEIRQLPQAVTLFMKRALPRFTVDTCVEAFILTLAKFIPIQELLGYLWPPGQQSNQRIRLILERDVLLHEQEMTAGAQVLQNKTSPETQDDLRLTLHRSLKSLQSDTAARKTLGDKGCRAAIEIHFTYYSRPILRVILGLSNTKLLPTTEAQHFLLIFCRCFLISLHGAYLAELDEREGLREKSEIRERFNLTLQWFHSMVRHLNIGLAGIQNGQTNEAEDALQRASIVAGVCLAEILSLMGKWEAEGTRGFENSGVAGVQESGVQ
jgi:hypothetical protein